MATWINYRCTYAPQSWTPLQPPSLLCPSRLSQSICFMRWTCTSHLFYIWPCICFNATLSNHPILSFSHWACMYPKETRIERDICTPMFIAALFTITRTWKQPRCPSADKWIRKLWCTYTMEYYSAVKRSTFESDLMRWMNLESVMQSEVSQKEKDKYSILIHIYGI